jgi:hypothetical protein
MTSKFLEPLVVCKAHKMECEPAGFGWKYLPDGELDLAEAACPFNDTTFTSPHEIVVVTTDVHSGLWECDGCGYTGTELALEQHVLEVNTLPDNTLRDPADVVCWGSMQIGSVVWREFHINGTHPMNAVMGKVVEAVIETGIDLNLHDNN